MPPETPSQFDPPTMPHKVRIAVDRLGGCYTCRYFGERRDPAVWCAYPGGEHVRSQAERGCSFWEREPGADDALLRDSVDQINAL